METKSRGIHSQCFYKFTPFSIEIKWCEEFLAKKCCVKLKLYSPNQHACLEKRNDSNKRQVSPEKRKISGISFITLHVRDKIILSDIRESKLRKQIECAWSMESAEEELNPKCVPKVYYDL